jgi:hypothetical protein
MNHCKHVHIGHLVQNEWFCLNLTQPFVGFFPKQEFNEQKYLSRYFTVINVNDTELQHRIWQMAKTDF